MCLIPGVLGNDKNTNKTQILIILIEIAFSSFTYHE